MKYLPFAVAFASFLASCSRDNPPPQQAPQTKESRGSITVPLFDGKKAFEYLKAQTGFGPRTAASSAHQNCLNYLASEMKKTADAVNLQPFEVDGYAGEK